MNKRELRSELLKKRNQIPCGFRQRASEAICLAITGSAAYEGAKKILLYSPISSEVDISGVAKRAIADEKELYFPRCNEEGGLGFYRVCKTCDLMPGKYGIMEPVGDNKLGVFMDALIIVPAVAADNDFFRLGYGGGYYDRFLPESIGARKIAAVYSELLVERLPREKHDFRLDGVVTESGLLGF